MGSSKYTLESYDDVLMRLLHFNNKDRDANREGLLTASQKKRIWRWQFAYSVAMWGVALAVLWVWQSRPSLWYSSGVKMICLALMAVAILFSFALQVHTFRVLSEGKVVSTYGPMKRAISSSGKGGITHWISIGDKQFRVGAELYGAMYEGEDYTLYYVAEIDYLLSAEFYPPQPSEPHVEEAHPLLQQLNTLFRGKQPAPAAENVIAQAPLLQQINELLSSKHETLKKKFRKKKGQ